MAKAFDLQKSIEESVETVVGDIIKATLKNPRESAFLVKFLAASRRASKIRMDYEKEGLHVPGFLIASITSSCNLHCAGCYSRCTEATVDAEPVRQLTGDQWGKIFREAENLGISFILLAGGEPMIRRDVIAAAGNADKILFPIFTNGTFLDERFFQMLEQHRNLMPVFSIEGDQNTTDARRGSGIYEKIQTNMAILKEHGILFGASITVTKKNLEEVSSDAFLDMLYGQGCRLAVFVEYTPMGEETEDLAPGDEERICLAQRLNRRREASSEMVLLSFPGDELVTGGCLAAGRGFFHINSHGGAEPCPFSPYSDINIAQTSLKEAISSPLFRELQVQGILGGAHVGGCVLAEKRDQVVAILNAGKEKTEN